MSARETPLTTARGKCSATRFTVEGYIEAKADASVEYVLQCVETLANDPSPHYTVLCDRVHANSDYSVLIGPDYISFHGEQPLPQKEPYRSAYGIVSEKEVTKHK